MPIAYQIREANEADSAAVIALFGVLDDLHTAAAPHQFRGSSAAPRSAQSVLDLLNDANAALLVAAVGPRIVGQAVVRIDTVPDRMPLIPRRFAQLYDLVVTADMRRCGIGQALVREAERWALARGMDALELTVWEFNEAARHMYDKLGYATQYRRLRRVLPA